MKPETITLISALGGVLIGSIVNLVISWITKRYEYRREFKKLVITSAVEQWKEMLSEARRDMVFEPRTRISSVMTFVLENSMIMDLIGDKDVDEKKVKAVVDKIKRINKVYAEYDRESKR